MKGGDEKTQSHHRRTHEAYDVPAGVPGPPRRPVVAPAGARTRGAGARTADALHDADLVRYQDTPVIALRARAVTAGRDVHPFGSVSTHRGRGEASEGGRGAGGGAERPWLGCRSGRRRCPLRHPSPSRTGTARVAHLGGAPPQRERHPGGRACRRGGEDPLAGRAATGWDDRSPTSRPCCRPTPPRCRSTAELFTPAIAARARPVTGTSPIHPYAATDPGSASTEQGIVPPPG